MDVKELIEANALETADVEFKHPEVRLERIVREITAFANEGGGTVIVGVTEADGGLSVVGVPNPQDLEERISQSVNQNVSPRLTPDFTFQTIGDVTDTVVIIEVSGSAVLHSYDHGKPVFPARSGSTTVYLDGYEIQRHYEEFTAGSESGRTEDELGIESVSISTETHPFGVSPQFIPRREGHIADVCTFGDIYTPGNPFRTTARGGRTDIPVVRERLGYVSDLFGLDSVRGQFTITQSNAAWVGSGLASFVEAITDPSPRYEALPDGFELDRYKSEQAVFICNLSLPYPESLLIIYVEPWVSDEFARQFRIALFTKGNPRDNRPLNAFGDATGMPFGPTEAVSFEKHSLSRPERLPVDLPEQVTGSVRGLGSGGTEPTGYLARNPFYNKADLVSQELGVPESNPLSSYEQVYGHFLQYPPSDVSDISPARFTLFEYGDVAEVPLNLAHVSFQLDW